MQAAVDPTKCEGHARCWDLCPEVFGLDEEGHGIVIVDVVPVELEAKASEAARNCPERAITLS